MPSMQPTTPLDGRLPGVDGFPRVGGDVGPASGLLAGLCGPPGDVIRAGADRLEISRAILIENSHRFPSNVEREAIYAAWIAA
jgi:hypothetical protein